MDEYKELVKLRDRLRQQKDKTQGAYDQILERIKTEMDCDSKESLEKLISKLKKKISLKLPTAEKAKEGFESKWAGKI